LKNDAATWTWGYNSNGQLGNGTTTNSSTPIQVSGLRGITSLAGGGWHSVANARVQPNPTATTTYGYDQLYRATNVDSTATTYAYDPVGNRLAKNTTSYTYDRADRILTARSVADTVNANGNPTGRGSDSFAYDQANRLTSATVGGTTSTYVYDGDGKRVSQTVGGTTTSYVYDVNTALPVVLTDGTLKYVYGNGLAYAVDGSGNVQVYHTDGLGSVRAITDANGNVTRTYQTDEFGVPGQTTGNDVQPFQYAGQQRDGETGYYFLGARYYDPVIGRFTSRDPAAGHAVAPSDWNRYAYVGNNPVAYNDPSGFCTDPGGPGIRFCIERFIPTASAWGFVGDNRGADAYGGTYRLRQDIYHNSDGTLTESYDAGLSVGVGGIWKGQQRKGTVGACWVAAAKSKVTQESIVTAYCQGTHGIIRTAPPIVSLITLDVTGGSARVVSVWGTPYPSMEVWEYGAGDPKLVYYLDATQYHTDPTDLFVPRRLPS
jgi:RHS repeat-associated protein